jgi:hypothetical protein
MTNAGSTAILLILLGGVSVWLIKQQQADAQEGLAEAQQQKAALEAAVGERKQEFQMITSALLLRKQVDAARAELGAARAQLTALENQEKTLRQQQRSLAENARRVQIGTVIPDLVLNDGRRPGQARVIKIDDDGVSFAVSTGVLRASAVDLPPDLRIRFHLQRK